MNEFGIFLYESGLSLSVLYIFYWFLLRKETYFSLNRIILVSTLLLALIIPFIRITFTGFAEQGSIVYVFDRFIMDPLVISPETVHAEKIQSISLIQIIYFIYFAGVIFFSLKFLVQFFQIFRLIKRYGTRKLFGYKIVPIDNNLSPFSFFNFIFINPGKIHENELKKVLYHEGEHARKLHTLDIILLEIICIIQWFNPFIWFYKLALREIHEYEADLRVIKSGENKLNYQQLILQQVFGNQFFQVVHHLLTNSLTKKRITMMTKIESKKRTILKSLLFLPVATLMVMIFSFTRGTEPNDLFDNLAKNGTHYVQADDGFIFPVSVDQVSHISANFGPFKHPFTKKVELHKGLDIVAETGTKIIASRGGTIIKTSLSNEGFGNNITVKHDDIYSTRYCHLQYILTEEGKTVEAGEVIGTLGNTGLSTAPHLHFELLKNDKRIDPSEYFSEVQIKGLKSPRSKVLQEQDTIVYETSEELPAFKDEDYSGFREFLIKNVRYPGEAKKNLLTGKVFVQFIIDTKGKVRDAKVIKAISVKDKDDVGFILSPLLEKEALRVVYSSSNSWEPGKNKGKPVNIRMVVPIQFLLNGDKKQEKPIAKEGIPEEEIFFIVEEMPSFQGKGLDGFREDWVIKQLKYPEIAAKKGIEGDVYVQFVVDKKGHVKKAVIMKGVDSLLDAEVLRVINSSPKWIPGKQRGQVVNVAFTFPVKFVLQESEKTEQVKPENVTDEIFFIVEEMPSFMGKGLDGFREEWVMKQLKYPEIAAKKGIEGDVYVQFVVDKKGHVKKAVIMKGVDSLLDAEVLRVINSSPKWIPGKQRGQVVNVAFTFPVKFVLQKPKKTEPEEKPIAKEEIPEEEIFFIVEEMPSFQEEGLGGFRDWVMDHLSYPEEAAKQGLEGTVYVQFVVNKKGDVTKTTIMRGAGPLLDAEALRVVKSSPAWIPGKQRGKEVNVAFTFPVKFSLTEAKKTELTDQVSPGEKNDK